MEEEQTKIIQEDENEQNELVGLCVCVSECMYWQINIRKLNKVQAINLFNALDTSIWAVVSDFRRFHLCLSCECVCFVDLYTKFSQ